MTKLHYYVGAGEKRKLRGARLCSVYTYIHCLYTYTNLPTILVRVILLRTFTRRILIDTSRRTSNT